MQVALEVWRTWEHFKPIHTYIYKLKYCNSGGVVGVAHMGAVQTHIYIHTYTYEHKCCNSGGVGGTWEHVKRQLFYFGFGLIYVNTYTYIYIHAHIYTNVVIQVALDVWRTWEQAKPEMEMFFKKFDTNGSNKLEQDQVSCSVLYCVAVYSSVLQSVAVCCSMRKYTSRNLTSAGICSSRIRCDASHLRCECSILHHTATHCNTNTATHYNTKLYSRAKIRCDALCCNVLQYFAVCGNARQEFWHKRQRWALESPVFLCAWCPFNPFLTCATYDWWVMYMWKRKKKIPNPNENWFAFP